MVVDSLPVIEAHSPARLLATVPNLLLQRERHRQSWTQSQVADALYARCTPADIATHGVVNAKMVSGWERGRHRPSLFWQRKLREVFGKSAADLGLLPEASLNTSHLVDTDQHQAEVVEGCLVIHTQSHGAIRFSPSGSKAVLRLLLAEHLKL